MYDIVIKNGKIVNGTGSCFIADIAVKGGFIVKMGALRETGLKNIDAYGKSVMPGFIDFHSHNDRVIMQKTPFLSKITQGVTTEIVGNCGFSAAGSRSGKGRAGIETDITSLLGHCPREGKPFLGWEEYLDFLEKAPLATNIIPLAGHNNIRAAVMGAENRHAEKVELARMEKLTAGIMEAGYWGISTGLIYSPGIFTLESEIVKLASISARYGGIYASHIRGEADTLLPSIREALSVGVQAGVSTQISHLKAFGRDNWIKTDEALELIYAARKRGTDVNYDQYPYTAGSTTALILLPPWMLEGGRAKLLQRLADTKEREKARSDMEKGVKGWQNLLSYGADKVLISRVKTAKNRRYEGKTFLEAAGERAQDCIEALFDLMLEEKGDILTILFLMGEESVRKILRQKIGFIGTDGIPCRHPHPRLWGSFPRVLAKYVREEKLLSLDDAAYKFAGGPAEKLRLSKRGEIKEGNFADMVILDEKKVVDTATFQHPVSRAKGIEYVIINGKTAIEKGRFTGVAAGMLLKKGAD